MKDKAYDAWFRASVQEALDCDEPTLSHKDAMSRLRAGLPSRQQ